MPRGGSWAVTVGTEGRRSSGTLADGTLRSSGPAVYRGEAAKRRNPNPVKGVGTYGPSQHTHGEPDARRHRTALLVVERGQVALLPRHRSAHPRQPPLPRPPCCAHRRRTCAVPSPLRVPPPRYQCSLRACERWSHSRRALWQCSPVPSREAPHRHPQPTRRLPTHGPRATGHRPCTSTRPCAPRLRPVPHPRFVRDRPRRAWKWMHAAGVVPRHGTHAARA